ncbi:EMC1_C domain-containing protein [Haematococcus lacustris]|uniref:ER membrane protein complex subunit 1 n=1 Tax=Haematococcus lacustris TaxID=44745 RepID=A0A699YK06_HAELA|nr:EMC1_C domain-containing protein [Haematococcus lacustris]
MFTDELWDPGKAVINTMALEAQSQAPASEASTSSGLRPGDRDLLAALNIRRCAVRISTLLLDNPALFVTLSGGKLRAWDQTEGVLRWEADADTHQAPHPSALAASSGARQTIGVFIGSQIKVGNLWSTTVNMHMTDGSSIRNTQASLPQPLSSIAVSAAWGMAALSADGSSVCTIASQHLLPAELPGVLLMALPAGDQGSASGQLTLTKAFPDASAVSQAAEAAAGQVVALVEVNQQGSVVVQYASTATGTILASDGSVKGSSIGVDKLAAGASPPGMRAALLGVFKKKDGSDGFRVLLVWADERIALLQQGVTVWARDEALAGVTNALFTDLPSAVAKGEAEGMDFNTFFKLQLLGFKLVPLGKVAVGDHAEQSLFLAVSLPQPGAAEGAAPQVHLLPDSDLARHHFKQHYRSTFFWLDHSGPSNTLLQGYGFDSVAVAALTSAAGGAATAVPVWSLALPEARLAVQGRRPEEPVYTAVKVLGDRSMKYRQLSPNLLLVVTGHAAAAQVPRDELDFLAAHMFTLTSLELFDASERQFSLLDTLFNPNATQPTSSFNPPPLELTAEEQEERLLPYSDTLPLNAPSFVSYNKQVLGLRGLISTASRLESTTLLFSWGVDLQFTRLAPAKGFDSLDDDFNYGLLVVALVALGVASVFMHWYTKSAILKSKWQ